MSSGSNATPTNDAITTTPVFTVVPKPASGPLSAEELVALNEEIAAMARAGLPLDQGLTALAREMGTGRLKKVTEQIAADLHAGHTLPQALDRQQGVVPNYYSALLTAGIRSGKLGEVLATLTLYARSIADFRSMILGALLYPMMVTLLGLGLLAFVSYSVLPGYAKVFEEMRFKLPLTTQVLLFVGTHPFAFFVVPPVTLLITFLATRFWLRRNAAGRMIWARFVNAIPVVGTLIRSARLAAFTDLLGILVDQSVPLPDALKLATEASTDTLIAEGGKHVVLELRQGVPLGTSLHRQHLVPELVVFMIGFGERQGTLGAALKQLAQMYRRQADVRAAFLRTILPPFLIILLAGSLVGMFVFGVMGPMFALLEALGGMGF